MWIKLKHDWCGHKTGNMIEESLETALEMIRRGIAVFLYEDEESQPANIQKTDNLEVQIPKQSKIKHIKDTAIVVTTFLRDHLLFRCVKSIRAYYPDIPIYIGDNGHPTKEKRSFAKRYNCRYVSLPFDCGVSGVRNRTLKKVKEKYIVIVENDIVFCDETDLGVWKTILDRKKDIGLVGGLLMRNEKQEQHYEAEISLKGDVYRIEKIKPKWQKLRGIRYFHCDMILNVFMMRKAVWERHKWDEQFKASLEHSDYFLSLKYTKRRQLRKNPWKIAYTDQVKMFHLEDDSNAEYNSYRLRPIAWGVFGEKWKVRYGYSNWNASNPIDFQSFGKPAQTEKEENLRMAIKILNKHKCKWWLEAGTCLGAIREGDFIVHDPDIDIGVTGDSAHLKDEFIKELQKAGFILYKEWFDEKTKALELSFTRKEIKLDLFFFYRRRNKLWHGAWKGKEFLPHVFSKELFDELLEIDFRDMKCYVPNPPEQYLEERYGENWRVPKKDYVYFRDCKAIDRCFFTEKKDAVFVGGVWDLFHIGHLNILRQAKKLGRRLIVGVLTDEATIKYKPQPVIPFKQRLEVIKSLKIIDNVIQQNNSDPTEDFKNLGLKPDYIIHGNDWSHVPGSEYVESYGGEAVILSYTHDISTTQIKNAIANIEKNKNAEKTIAVCIKTFMRENSLKRSIEGIQKNIALPYRLYIADDSNPSNELLTMYERLKTQGHRILYMPPDSGIARGRNYTVREAKEPYVFVMDDDILLIDRETVEKLKTILDSNQKLGLVSGVLIRESGDYFANKSYSHGVNFQFENGKLVRNPANSGFRRNGSLRYRYADQVVNFFLARRELFNDVQWDNRIKVEYEHMDFFLQLKKTKWKAAVCPDVKAIHINPQDDFQYIKHRRKDFRPYFLKKWNLKGVEDRF